MAGKGHAVRPRKISYGEWEEEHNRIFGKSPKENYHEEEVKEERSEDMS